MTGGAQKTRGAGGQTKQGVIAERVEQRVALIMWGAGKSKDKVAKDMQPWASGAVPYRERKNFEEFLRDPEGKEFSLLFENDEDAVKFAEFVDRCGLFRRVDGYLDEPTPEDLMGVGRKEGMVVLTLTAVPRKYPKPLTKKETKALSRIESGTWERTKEERSEVEEWSKMVKSDDPLGGYEGGEILTTKRAEVRPRKADVEVEKGGFRGFYMSRSTGKKVPLFDKNWEKNEERRVELWSDLWNSGKCSFEVSKRVLRKFESSTFQKQFLSHLRARGIENPKIGVSGSKVTITGRRKITKAELTEIAMGKRNY